MMVVYQEVVKRRQNKYYDAHFNNDNNAAYPLQYLQYLQILAGLDYFAVNLMQKLITPVKTDSFILFRDF